VSGPAPSRPSESTTSWRGVLHLLVVYVVWSSTYLAIRLAVRPGAGFPPFKLGAMRCLLAVPFLLVWAASRGARIWPTRREVAVLASSGGLLWITGNGFVVLAEQRADSALAALMVSSTPVWVALSEALIDRRRPSTSLVLALCVGFMGTGLIAYPGLRSGVRADVVSVIVLLLGSLSWGLGSLLQRRHPVDLDAIASAAYQQLFGGLGVLSLSFIVGEPLPTPTPMAWLGFAFLLVFGSLFAFTSYLTALRLLPTRVVFTYAYVNPVLAALLGWLFLDERISGWTLGGAALVLLGVAGTFRLKR